MVVFFLLEMNATRSLLKVLPESRVALQLQQSREMSAIASPPKVRISFAEKVAHGLFIAVGVLTVPVYVLVNVKNYRAKPGN